MEVIKILCEFLLLDNFTNVVHTNLKLKLLAIEMTYQLRVHTTSIIAKRVYLAPITR